MNDLNGYTLQSRGQRFNDLIAEILQCWGIDAESSTRSEGEIDVTFELGGKQFIAEAKWESRRTGTGPIAKLQKRLRQRLDGTIGTFISMAGYTEEALRDLKQGERLRVLLLGRDHLEAMFSGFASPDELLASLVRRASHRGTAYVGLVDLLALMRPPELNPDFGHPPEIQPLVRESISGFQADVVLSCLPFGQAGIAETEPEVVLLTSSDGVFRVDLKRKEVKPWLPIPNCSRNPVVRGDGSVFVVRHAGVARIDRSGQLKVVAGGLVGNVCLSLGRDNTVWAFGSGLFSVGLGGHPVAVRVGDRLGSQIGWPIDYPPAQASVAAHVDNDTLIVCGGNSIALVSPTSRHDVISARQSPLTNPGGLIRVSADRFLIACNDVELWELTLSSKELRKVAELRLRGSVYELTSSREGGGYLFCYYTARRGESRGVVVRWRYP